MQSGFPILQELRWRNEYRLQRMFRYAHESDFYAFSKLKLSDKPILDVGANRGQSIESFRSVLPGKAICSFEPNRFLAEKLRSRYAHTPDVKINDFGLGDEPGSFVLYIPKYKKWIYDGLSSLDRNEAASWLNQRTIWRFDENELHLIEVECDIVTLDSLDMSASVIKIDVQGYELQALKGGSRTIEAHRPVIMLESATDEIVSFLGGFGYIPHIQRNGAFVADRTDAVNCFFLRPEHL